MTEEKEPGLLTNLEERVSQLEARTTRLEQDILAAGLIRAELAERVTELESRLSQLEEELACNHVPVCLPSRHGPVPILPVNIADARKISVITPGQPPPIAFAIAICKKCGQSYIFINKLDEAEPFEGGPPPVLTVKPGEPVGGSDL